MLEGTARAFASIGGVAATGDAVWVGDRTGSLIHIDPATNTITRTLPVPVRPDQVRADGDHVAVADLRGGAIAVVAASDGAVIESLTGLEELAGIALYQGSLYFQDATDGTVTRLDLRTGERVSSLALGASVKRDHLPTWPAALTVGRAGVLVDTANQPDSLVVLDPVTLVQLDTLVVSADHGDMTLAADGSAWVVRDVANQLIHITPQSG